MITKYVNTNTGASAGDQDGSTNTPGSTGTAAFATLAQAISWIVANDATLSDDYTIECCGLNADTAQVNFSGYTVGSFSITVRGNPNEADGAYDGNEVISSSHYRHIWTSASDGVAINAPVTIERLQFENSAGSFRAAIKHIANVPATIRNNRVRNTGSTRTGIGHPGVAAALDSTLTIEGNLIVGFNSNGVELIQSSFRTGHWEVRNNTIYGDGSSVGVSMNFASSGTPTAHIENNAIANCGASADFFETGTGTATYANNATEGGANGTTGEVDIGTLTDAWTAPGTAANADFTIKSTSSALYDAGVSVDPTNDVRGIAYVTDDIGAFAFEDEGGGSVSGTFDVTIDNLSQSATATAKVAGVATQTIANITQAAVAKAIVKAAAAQTISNITQSAEGVVTNVVSGEFSQTLDNITMSAEGELVVTGTFSQTISNITQSAAGTVEDEVVDGVFNKTIDNITQSAAGGVSVSGTFSVTIDPITVSATSTVIVVGTAAQTIDNITLTATGLGTTTIVIGSAAILIDNITMSAAAKAYQRRRLRNPPLPPLRFMRK